MSVKVRVLSALMFRGQPHGRGALLDVAPFDAHLLCASGRAELADPANAEQVRKVVEHSNRQVLAGTGFGRAARH